MQHPEVTGLPPGPPEGVRDGAGIQTHTLNHQPASSELLQFISRIPRCLPQMPDRFKYVI